MMLTQQQQVMSRARGEGSKVFYSTPPLLDREGLSSSQTCDPETLARISNRKGEQRDDGWPDLCMSSATKARPCPAYDNYRQRRK